MIGQVIKPGIETGNEMKRVFSLVVDNGYITDSKLIISIAVIYTTNVANTVVTYTLAFTDTKAPESGRGSNAHPP